MATKLQQSGLVPVKFERKLLEPHSHRVPEAPCMCFVLKARHDIVGVTHKDNVACSFSPSPLRGPEVKDVVKEDVCKQR